MDLQLIREQAVRRLAEGVELRTGIKILPQTEEKLLRIFGAMRPDMLQAWVGELDRLPPDHPEWLSVVENLTVHETFLFRDRPQLEVLRRDVMAEIVDRAAKGDRRIAIWSAGCATGEEVYTLAVLLLETMLEQGHARGTPEEGVRPAPGWLVGVLGTDISRPVLQLARQGIYHTGELSPFRSVPETALRWFEETEATDGSGQRLRRARPCLRAVTDFRPFNLASAQRPEERFDLVLCRNVFIYLSRQAQHIALHHFAGALTPGGTLMLGTTDRMDLTEMFDTEWNDSCVVYRRRGRGERR